MTEKDVSGLLKDLQAARELVTQLSTDGASESTIATAYGELQNVEIALQKRLSNRPIPRKTFAEGISRVDDSPFSVLSEHFVTTTEMRPLLPTAPPILISYDFKRSFIDQYGYDEARKMQKAVRATVFDYVVAATHFGKIRIEDIEASVVSSTGVAAVKKALIDGKHEDFATAPRRATPVSIYTADVRIREGV